MTMTHHAVIKAERVFDEPPKILPLCHHGRRCRLLLPFLRCCVDLKVLWPEHHVALQCLESNTLDHLWGGRTNKEDVLGKSLPVELGHGSCHSVTLCPNLAGLDLIH